MYNSARKHWRLESLNFFWVNSRSWFFNNLNRCHLEAQGIFFSNILRTIGRENSQKLPCNVASLNSRRDLHRLASSYQTLTAVYRRRPFLCRTQSMQTGLEEYASLQSRDNPNSDIDPSIDSEDEFLSQPHTSEQVYLYIYLIFLAMLFFSIW